MKRLLELGEEIKDGDEIYVSFSKGWEDVGRRAPGFKFESFHRPIKRNSSYYYCSNNRLLEEGEIIMKDDEFLMDTFEWVSCEGMHSLGDNWSPQVSGPIRRKTRGV